MAMTPDGCSACGGTYFYISNHRCMECIRRGGLARTARRQITDFNGHAGIRLGFVWFGSVAHKILLHLDKNGPSGHSEILGGVGTTVTTDLRKLVKAGFIEVIGEARELGGRPFSVYDITGRSAKLPPVRRMSKAEMIREYRKRRRARVASVFDFRGQIEINERKSA